MMVLKIIEKITQTYMEALKEINQRRNATEQKLYTGNRNKELLELMKIQKSLVYFVTALRSNELMLMKITRTNFLGLNEEEKEFLEDLIVDISQGLEMANIYTNILSSTLDAFASIINNNMNNVLKRFTSIFLILAFPALVTVIYKMHVPIPYSASPYAFYISLILSIAVAAGISWYFMKKKWF